ncbi:hypothetical protein SRB5_66270 [Streptomyces sp. RB5]|uniref:Uncharacterized protein n=1 Tax=Streptomyces smaragdinus TaxID=2585196 RepID=A0A7K0CSM1_9ACTN|nr:SGM_5486 family transporter-associated protein [Streptomyces smaragdinus]MQY16428.1 hypothetical protein [Streptomyces smaragdinus]
MPVLEPNPQGGQRKLLMILALIAGITIAISVVATILA